MKKKIAILGSTGSIGNSLMSIVGGDKNIKIELLSSNTNTSQLIKQAKKFNVKNLIITDPVKFILIKKRYSKYYKIYNNFDNFDKIFKSKIDYTMNAIVGFSGLNPTLKIIKHTKKIAIANKESIICGWNLIQNELKKNKTEIIPVDSEHFSIWSLLNNYKIKKNHNLENLIDNIVITASGGPFLNTPLKDFKKIKIKNAIRHPTWKMGKKISIDSATLVNKLFEVIETQRLFGIRINKVLIKIHKQSYIHSIISFKNGLIKICAHNPDMIIPIYNSLKFDENLNLNLNSNINFDILNNLKFTEVDKKKFSVINILKNYPNHCTLLDTALVTINDELVNLFLNNKINFTDISTKLIKILNIKEIKRLKNFIPKNYDEIKKINDFVRLKTLKLCIL